MKKIIFCVALGALLLVLYVSADAQQTKKVPRIGYLSPSDSATESSLSEAIRRVLRELGYIEGENIAIEYRYAEERSSGSLSLRPSWCVSRSISSWHQEGRGWYWRPGMRPRRFPSLWWALGSILSRRALLKALPVPAATSPALQPFPEN